MWHQHFVILVFFIVFLRKTTTNPQQLRMLPLRQPSLKSSRQRIQIHLGCLAWNRSTPWVIFERFRKATFLASWIFFGQCFLVNRLIAWSTNWTAFGTRNEEQRQHAHTFETGEMFNNSCFFSACCVLCGHLWAPTLSIWSNKEKAKRSAFFRGLCWPWVHRPFVFPCHRHPHPGRRHITWGSSGGPSVSLNLFDFL